MAASALGSTRDPPVGHVENLAGRAEIGKRRRIGAGHPDLGAQFRQFDEQRAAAEPNGHGAILGVDDQSGAPSVG